MLYNKGVPKEWQSVANILSMVWNFMAAMKWPQYCPDLHKIAKFDYAI